MRGLLVLFAGVGPDLLEKPRRHLVGLLLFGLTRRCCRLRALLLQLFEHPDEERAQICRRLIGQPPEPPRLCRQLSALSFPFGPKPLRLGPRIVEKGLSLPLSGRLRLGNRLLGTTTVTFNGVPATSFTVQSDTYMTAVVPSGATTGKVVVTTPGGTLTSNVNFRIIQ